ncbi:MAG: hypothetical protein JW704_09875 [Anaerolineaceae bacterium]|nr:hypothetical protein [Anaerolineaceae bacterium]
MSPLEFQDDGQRIKFEEEFESLLRRWFADDCEVMAEGVGRRKGVEDKPLYSGQTKCERCGKTVPWSDINRGICYECHDPLVRFFGGDEDETDERDCGDK